MTSENTLDTIAASRGVTIEFTESRTSVNVCEDGMPERRAVRLPDETKAATRARILSNFFHPSAPEWTTLMGIRRAENAKAARAEPAEDTTCELGCDEH